MAHWPQKAVLAIVIHAAVAAAAAFGIGERRSDVGWEGMGTVSAAVVPFWAHPWHVCARVFVWMLWLTACAMLRIASFPDSFECNCEWFLLAHETFHRPFVVADEHEDGRGENFLLPRTFTPSSLKEMTERRAGRRSTRRNCTIGRVCETGCADAVDYRAEAR